MATATRKAPIAKTKAPAKSVEDNAKAQGERDLDRKAQLILDLLADGPVTRADIGVYAKKNEITDSELGRIKAAYKIAHCRIVPDASTGNTRSTFAWLIAK